MIRPCLVTSLIHSFISDDNYNFLSVNASIHVIKIKVVSGPWLPVLAGNFLIYTLGLNFYVRVFILMVFYLFIRFLRYSVNLEINCNTCKLV
jgi:hypothetical protein